MKSYLNTFFKEKQVQSMPLRMVGMSGEQNKFYTFLTITIFYASYISKW